MTRLLATRLINVCESFPLYTHSGAGYSRERSRLVIQSVNRLIPALNSLAGKAAGRKATVMRVEHFPTSEAARHAAAELKKYLDGHGSDKASNHYHWVYGEILSDRFAIKNLLEVGLGTNNTSMPSHMGSAGRPGASLRAFRDYLPGATIYGADVDREILFREERIETHFVDQTDPGSFAGLNGFLPDGLDLIIDDGLHAPDANIETLAFGLRKVNVGGWIVIEDIPHASIALWEVVAALLPQEYETYIVSSEFASLFVLRRRR
jgi:hypothetical protein